jgi:hypothetical protein
MDRASHISSNADALEESKRSVMANGIMTWQEALLDLEWIS